MRLGFAKSPVDVVRGYVSAVNRHDLAAIEDVLADDVRLIDSAGNEVAGKTACLDWLRRISAIAPDFRLHIDDFTHAGEDVLMRGKAQASDPRLSLSTHFRARADEKQLRERQSFSAHPGGVIEYVNSRTETVTPSQQVQASAKAP